ncbi:hypothetical protein HMPREF1870_00638 [Bacteroidales bacterium KA00344]|nr:hypothetical protein HMPREF1870_00638 [Bacteroidales bacterium KA00344]
MNKQMLNVSYMGDIHHCFPIYSAPIVQPDFCLERRAFRWLSKDNTPMTEQHGENCIIKEKTGNAILVYF